MSMKIQRERSTSKMALTSLSAMVAETTTFPIDLTKTRLQLHSSTRPTNAFRVASEIVGSEQGLLGLYKGLSPAILRHLFYTPIRIVGYEHFRTLFGNDASASLSLSAKALLGGLSGVIAQVIYFQDPKECSLKILIIYIKIIIIIRLSFCLPPVVQVVASPADLVKVRMQADGRMVCQGLRPRYSGPFEALNKIVRSEGFGGLWRGVFPNVQRAFLVNMGELACYDHAKYFVIQNRISEDNVYAHTLASLMSGLSATALSCPADVVKTRMMNQAVTKEGNILYRNSYDCLLKTVKIEGLKALWKGFFPTWARLGPWQFVFWVSYEKFRKIAGLSSF